MQPPGVDEFKKEKKKSVTKRAFLLKRIRPSFFFFLLKGEALEPPVALSLSKTFTLGPFSSFILSSFSDAFM